MTNETIELKGDIDFTGVETKGGDTFIAYFTIDGKEAKAEWSIEDLYCNLTDWSTLSEYEDATVVSIDTEHGSHFVVRYAKDGVEGADGWDASVLVNELREYGDDLETYLI